MIDKNSFKEYCRVRRIEYTEELWKSWVRLTKNAVKRAANPFRKTLMQRDT